tara:strand:+ start:29 stop:364 length:336 start_codon:yes stop_codon:yes gene_type:complete
MKLTQQRLMEIIEQELKSINENPMQPEAPPQPGADATEKGEDSKQKSLNLTTLGDEMIATGRAIKGSKIKGLDTNEIKLVSAILANVLEVSSSKSAGTLLNRLNDLIEKNK